ncbi:MAG TPA: cupin domain-containing protein [Mycobacteriales bacterium]|nr:cupin domain-containing protein [Mycobacteriales bacterium]
MSSELSGAVPGASTSDRPALRRCIGMDPEAFATGHWATRPLLTPAAGDFGDLFSLAAVDELTSTRGLRTPFLRVAKEGKVVEPARFTRGGGAGAEIGDQLADDRLAELFADGSTLVLQGLHRTWPPLVDFGGRLAAELGHPVQINAYVTPPQNKGFSAHFDVHDVFVLQVAGEKRWTIHEPVHEAPLRDQEWTRYRAAVAKRAAGEPAIDAVLRPGDALYLPRGWLHSAEALGDVSVHLTVGIHSVTRYALVQALTALAAEEPELRASLPLGVDVADPDQLGPDLAATVEALVGWLGKADPAAVADRVRRRVWTATRPEPVGPLAQAAAARSVTDATVVRVRGGLRHRLRPAEGGTVTLELPDRTLSLPAGTADALRALLSGQVLAVTDLPGLDAADGRTLVTRLLRESVVVPAQG